MRPQMMFKNGTCVAAIYAMETESGRTWAITLQRRYLEGKKWEHTNDFRVDDIPKAILTLQKVYDYLTTNFWNKEERDLPKEQPEVLF